MTFLAVLAIFKNERHILGEWLEHYLREGVDHFVMIDNGSEDAPLEVLQPYMDNGRITYHHDTTRHAQAALYNQYAMSVKDRFEWWMIVDLDEFVYASRKGRTIAAELRDMPLDVNGIQLPWVPFGSNGHRAQPASVVCGFTRRAALKQWESQRIHLKMIVRAATLRAFHVHTCEYTVPEPRVVLGDGSASPNVAWRRVPTSEAYHARAALRLNHYCLQSRDWWERIKCTRGDVDSALVQRTVEEFEQKDEVYNQVEDTSLAHKSFLPL